ncbi:MAG: hypothetical protein AAGF11_12750 [Myxococcota bacterium]
MDSPTPVECIDRSPVAVPDPPPGCRSAYLRGPTGSVDPERPAGYWICGRERSHDAVYRVAAVACNCDYQFPPCAEGGPDDCGDQGACAAGESCSRVSGGACRCLVPCTQDSDCGPGQACLCASGALEGGTLSSFNRCVPADCTDDAGCSGDRRCKIADDICWQPWSLRCTTPVDECVAHSDCPADYCRWDEVEEFWMCDAGAICE